MRDVSCRFPGCAASAWRSDIDHAHPFSEGGATDLDNLESLCRRHHTLKHHGPPGGAWRIEHLGHGVLAWTDPAGHVYIDEPVPIGTRARRPHFTDTTTHPPEPEPPPAPPPF